ncbi:O-antigen ligase family protein [Larkinella terrae]
MFVKPFIQFGDLSFLNIKAHFFYIIPALFVIAFFIYATIYKFTINLNQVDFLLLIYAIYTFFNFKTLGLEYNENLILFILSIVIVLLIKQLCFHKQFGVYVKYGCFLLLISIGLIEAVYGELQILGFKSGHHKLFNLTGTFQNPGPYAIFLSPVFILSLAIVLFPPTPPVLAKVFNLMSWLSLIGISCILPATQSRSAWIGAIVGSSVVIYIRYKTEFLALYAEIKTAGRLGISLTILLLLFAVSYLLYQFKPESADGRALVWRVGSGLFNRNILFGIGFEQFKAHFGNLQSEFMETRLNNPALVERADYVPYAFNDFLQILIENGLVGLIIFVAVLILTFRNGFRQIHTKSPFLIGSLGALVSLSIAGFFSYPFEVPIIWLSFLFFIGIISFLSKEENIKLAGHLPGVKILAVSAIYLMILVLKNEIHLIKAKADWRKARDLLSSHSYEKSADIYRAAFAQSPRQPEVLLGYGKALYMTGKFKQSATVLEKASAYTSDPFLYMNLGNAYLKLNQYTQSEKAYKKAVSIIPNRLYPRYLLARMYVETGDFASAKNVADYIIKMPIPVSSPASRQIMEEMKKLLNQPN